MSTTKGTKKNPAAVALGRLGGKKGGRKGGLAKVPKGFAKMSPKRLAAIAKKGGSAVRRKK